MQKFAELSLAGLLRGFHVFRTARLIVLLVHDFVQLELVAELFDDGWLGGEMVVHVVTVAEAFAAVRELAFADAVDLFELGAFGFDVAAEIADESVNRFFFADGVEDDESFVVTFHGWWMCLVLFLEVREVVGRTRLVLPWAWVRPWVFLQC